MPDMLHGVRNVDKNRFQLKMLIEFLHLPYFFYLMFAIHIKIRKQIFFLILILYVKSTNLNSFTKKDSSAIY